jgi:hypothetical protein
MECELISRHMIRSIKQKIEAANSHCNNTSR